MAEHITDEVRRWEAIIFEPFRNFLGHAVHYLSLDDEQQAKFSEDTEGLAYNVRCCARIYF